MHDICMQEWVLKVGAVVTWMHLAQPARSASSFSSEGHNSGGGGFKGSSEYSRSQLEASAAQKDTYFARKMQVPPHGSACMGA